jgi:hypothetical protein
MTRQEQLEERAAANQQALEQAGRPDLLENQRSPLFVEKFGEADISDPEDPDDDIESVVATETSRQHTFANLDEDEYERQRILLQATAEQVRREFIPRSGFGSKCTGEYREILTGVSEAEHPPVLTPTMARRVNSAIGEEGVRSEQLSQARDGKAFEGLTQIQSSVYTDTGEAGGGRGAGVLGKTKSLLGFGD